MWSAIVNVMTKMFDALHSLIVSLGVSENAEGVSYVLAIVLFTAIIRLLILPLNIKATKSNAKMQEIQPEMQKLQKKYANDQEKLQREMMKIYKENNISMTGGCLPMLIQMPILIGLYQVIQKPLSYLAGVDWANASVINEVIRLKDAMVNLGYNIGNLANATMEQLANNSQIQLSKWAGIVGTQGTALGLDLSNAPSAAFGHIMALDFSNMSVILLLLIPVLAVIASVISMKVTQAQTGQNQNTEGQAAQMTKSMNLMMPVMTAFFTVTLPAGLGLYWIISSVVQILQQLILNAFLDKKGEEIVVTVPEKKQQHRKKRKK